MRRIFVCGFCCHVGRIVNYVTKVAAKSTDKKASEIGILINASSLRALFNTETAHPGGDDLYPLPGERVKVRDSTNMLLVLKIYY